MALSEAPIW